MGARPADSPSRERPLLDEFPDLGFRETLQEREPLEIREDPGTPPPQ
jgi:hypothetical protein